jgi:hypothetical protein
MVLKEIVVNQEFIDEMSKYRAKPEGKSLVQACSENIVLFSEYMLGIKLRAWQIYVLVEAQKIIEGKSPYRELVALTSRQIGKTTIAAIISKWCAIFNKKPSGIYLNTPVGIISASDEQAKKLVGEIKKLSYIGDKFMFKTYKTPDGKPAFGKEKILQELIDKSSANNTDTITFSPYNPSKHGEYFLKDSISGTFIKSYPPTALILGNTYALAIVDEAGKSDRIPDNVFLDYLSPATDEFDAPTFYFSTAWSPSGIFFEKCDVDDIINDPSVLRVMFTIDAIKIEAPTRYAKTIKKIERLNADGKIEEVQRAYYCKFVNSQKSYFNIEKVNKIFKEDLQKIEVYSKPCDLGVDFGGQVVSRTCLTISTLDDDNKPVRIWDRVYEVGQDNNLIQDIEELFTRFKIQRIIPDDCPQGDYLIRQMREKGWNIHPIKFRSEKVAMFGAFRVYVNKGLISSYIDLDLKTEMLALEQKEGSRQSVIGAASGYRDDKIDSFVLSTYFMVDRETDLKYHQWSDNKDE